MKLHKAILKKQLETLDDDDDMIAPKAYEDKLKYLDRMLALLGKMDKKAKVANITFGQKALKRGTEFVQAQAVINKVLDERREVVKFVKANQNK